MRLAVSDCIIAAYLMDASITCIYRIKVVKLQYACKHLNTP